MNRLIFMLEEPSMKALLEVLLPRLFPELEFICVPHEGKSDLEQSLPRKLRNWLSPDDRFVVLRDNDGGNCKARKAALVKICEAAGRKETMVRIVCQELEAWYLGDLAALATAFEEPRLIRLGNRAKFRDPDVIGRPSDELARIHPTFQKVDGARRMGAHLTYAHNRSRSFRVMIEGVARMTGLALPT